MSGTGVEPVLAGECGVHTRGESPPQSHLRRHALPGLHARSQHLAPWRCAMRLFESGRLRPAEDSTNSSSLAFSSQATATTTTGGRPIYLSMTPLARLVTGYEQR